MLISSNSKPFCPIPLGGNVCIPVHIPHDTSLLPDGHLSVYRLNRCMSCCDLSALRQQLQQSATLSDGPAVHKEFNVLLPPSHLWTITAEVVAV